MEERGGKERYSLCVYDTGAKNHQWRLLDKVVVDLVSPLSCRPRVDHMTHHVYVPCLEEGVCVFQLENGRLVTVKKLLCVISAHTVAVHSSSSIFVGDRYNGSVFLVDTTLDTVIRKLSTPKPAEGLRPYHMSAVGATLLVNYDRKILVLYRNDELTSAQVLQTPNGLRKVSSVTSHGKSNFLVSDFHTAAVFVLDDKRLCHTFNTATDSKIWDCASVKSEVWFACYSGSIISMAPP